MNDDFIFVIPTYRLRDVGSTVEAYRIHLDKFGHTDIPIVVFDDSNIETHQRNFPFLAARKPKNTWYVGPQEKQILLDTIVNHLGTAEENTLRKLFLPSYGGNRNWGLIYAYALQKMVISVDDDMAPVVLEYAHQQPLEAREVLRGVFRRKNSPQDGLTLREYDLVAAYRTVLGKKVREVDPRQYPRGDTLRDSMTELFSNRSAIHIEENLETKISLDGPYINPNARIIVAQSFKAGIPDLDATDFAADILNSTSATPEISLRYIPKGHKPCITSKNWRFDTSVAAYDCREGLPPFLPTELRTEEYSLRILGQHPDFAAAHVDAVQHHQRSPSQRNNIPYDILNEELVSVLRQKLRGLVRKIEGTSILFEPDGHLSLSDTEQILEHVRPYHTKALQRREDATSESARNYFAQFADDLEHAFLGFEKIALQKAAEKRIIAEIDTTVKAMNIWPEVLEVTQSISQGQALPMRQL